jgi:long-subunit acyl-CoA synthetase (AMP-forming)
LTNNTHNLFVRTMENLIALRARQLAYIRAYNAALRSGTTLAAVETERTHAQRVAVTARNRAAWVALFASNPDLEAICAKPATVDPKSLWPP